MAVFFSVLFISFVALMMKSTHLLSFLIALEFMGLVVFFVFLMTQVNNLSMLLLTLFLLGSMGCESVLGLVLFVLVTRSSSKDYLSHMTVSKF